MKLLLILFLSATAYAQGHSLGGNLANVEQYAGAKAEAGVSEDREVRPISSLPPEFGKETELKGITKVYIASPDLEARKLIVKELAKESRLVVTERVQDADLLLGYQGAAQANGATFTPFGSVNANMLQIGEMAAVVRAGVDKEGKRLIRILWSSRKSQQWAGGMTFSRHPAVNGAREFLKAWRKANP